jgi:hypothetical protein
MTIRRHGRRLLSGEKTAVQKDRSVATLTPEMIASQWKPGQSGNPSGRPSKTPFTDVMRELLAEEYVGREKRFKGMTNLRVLAIRLFDLAIAGDLRAAEEVVNRVEGRTVQVSQLQGPDGGAIPFAYMSREENEKRIAELLAIAGGPDRDSTE